MHPRHRLEVVRVLRYIHERGTRLGCRTSRVAPQQGRGLSASRVPVHAETVRPATGGDPLFGQPVDVRFESRAAGIAERVFRRGYEASADYVFVPDPDELPGFRVRPCRFAALGVAGYPAVGFGVGEIVGSHPSVSLGSSKSEVTLGGGNVDCVAGVVFRVPWRGHPSQRPVDRIP